MGENEKNCCSIARCLLAKWRLAEKRFNASANIL